MEYSNQSEQSAKSLQSESNLFTYVIYKKLISIQFMSKMKIIMIRLCDNFF